VTDRRRVAWIVGVATLALAGGIGLQLWRLGLLGGPPAAVAGEWVLAAQFSDLKGQPQTLSQWRGKVMVVNWWATWCAPCREEMPIFVELQRKYGDRGLIFIGLAVDQKARVESFAREFGINYPLLLGEVASIDLARRLGNSAGGMPYSVVIDRQGRVAFTHLGAVKQPEFEKRLAELL
jgi:thiol-disulfide isomerase/thioredoxin